MSGRLTGKTAFVTGAANGIGAAITRRFLAEGATVAATDIAVADLQLLAGAWAADAPERAGDLLTLRCDVTDPASLSDACAATVARFGRLDIAVANAGRGTFSPIVDHSLEEWRAVVDLCLTGVFLTVQQAARVMADGGSIVTVASMNAVQPAAGMAAYCAAKAGVVMLTQVAAMELGPRGIRVNAVAPGLVRTNATAAFWQLPGVVGEFAENAPLGRFAQPDEVASVALFLASDDSSFVSASTYAVDGGGATGRYPDLPAAIARATRPDGDPGAPSTS
jgi:NAD(P)-dependent dehydrogenase (short-subunit alcohol dehydrogenase family)